MGRNPAPYEKTNTNNTLRARDNKRRHRARQKEYVLDLERRVAVTREQGVQATKEVQLAAQRVTRENVKLRDLLRRTGYADSVIDAWVREDECFHSAERPQLVVKSPSEKIAQNVASACAANPRNVKVYPTASATVHLRRGSLEESPTQVSAATCESSSQQPCKLVTLLAENPAADITQVSLSTDPKTQLRETNEPEDHSFDGIECSAAYSMLMRHATSSKRMDRIAAALESGCTPSGTGRCSVKRSVVWRTLDEECA
ncbi:hypothetical protein GQ44DRAFT_704482 [Phaeosphaeriaceae sp. PMI808]|nr:hypothetical protein GQ44DRAFT_704482 [Phaeosphaeriaceae sp. PMI808]